MKFSKALSKLARFFRHVAGKRDLEALRFGLLRELFENVTPNGIGSMGWLRLVGSLKL